MKGRRKTNPIEIGQQQTLQSLAFALRSVSQLLCYIIRTTKYIYVKENAQVKYKAGKMFHDKTERGQYHNRINRAE